VKHVLESGSIDTVGTVGKPSFLCLRITFCFSYFLL